MVDVILDLLTFGYSGMFFLSFLTSAGVFFSLIPIPSSLYLLATSSFFNPFVLGLMAGLGASVGECSAYLVGRAGNKVIVKRYKKQLKSVKEKFEEYSPEFWIFALAVTPLPDDIAGIFCGVTKYDFKKYFVYMAAGKIILSLFLAYTGYLSKDVVASAFHMFLR